MKLEVYNRKTSVCTVIDNFFFLNVYVRCIKIESFPARKLK